MARKAKIGTKNVNLVQLLSENEAELEFGEAVASIAASNPSAVWVKFILTDDMRNSNNMRIPYSEFKNLIRTGIFMPFKMSRGEIDDHAGSEPLGVITNLVESTDEVSNARMIKALAALWYRERPDDVDLLRSKILSGEQVGVSWEIIYNDFMYDEDGVMNLLDTALAAATVVKYPAYVDRTPIMMVASAGKWSKAYIDQLPDSSFLYIEDGGSIDEYGKTYPRSLRHLALLDENGDLVPSRIKASREELASLPLDEARKSQIARALDVLESRLDVGISDDDIRLIFSSIDITEEKLEEFEALRQKVSELEKALEESNAKIGELEAALAEKESAISQATAELESLRSFKAEMDEKALKEAKLADIRQKFESSGIIKGDEFFSEHAESLLSLDDKSLEFMIQELVAFSKSEGGEGGAASMKILPNFTVSPKEEEMSVENIVQALKAWKSK